MKLNLHILWDELQQYGGSIICPAGIRSLLTGVRYVDSSNAALSEQFLYLVDPQKLANLPVSSSRLSFICTGAVDRAVLENRGWSAILLPESADQRQVFRTIQEIFEKYAQWEQEMLLAIANNEPLQSIFDTGVRFLPNPIALFDIRQAYITMAGTLPADIRNTVWEEVLSRRTVKIENLSKDEQRLMAKALADRDDPFFYQDTETYKDHQQMIASLKRSGVPFATLGSIDIVRPFTLGQLSILAHLKNFMELALKNDLQLASITEGSSYYVDRLLQGFPVERSAVEYHLSKTRWHIEDDYCLSFFTRPDNAQVDPVLNEMLTFRIRSMLGDAMVFPYENGILAISHQDNRARADQAFSRDLDHLVEKLDLHCGVSLVFQDFLNIKYAYIQCKTALPSASSASSTPQQPAQRINLFETRYTDHIIQALDVSTSLKSLCHPLILRLYSAEPGKGREFIQSLQTYLINGRNTSATASQLFIHRNTLLYRLKRIEEILGIDLETADEQTLFILYLSCLMIPYIH